MKKFFFNFCGCIFMSFVILLGCQGSSDEPVNENDLNPSNYENINALAGVVMSEKEGTLTPAGMTVILDNQSGKDIVYRSDYSLEEKIDGQWYELPVIVEGDYGFNSIGYELPPTFAQE